jgi:transposase-like protein
MTSTSSPDSSVPAPSAFLSQVPVTLDGKGRVRVSKEQRRVILAEFERSGVSAAQFARRTGLKYSTLAGWVQRYRRAKPKGPPRAVRLLEAVVAEAEALGSKTPPALAVELPGGARVEISNVQQVTLAAALIRALTQPC